MPRDPHAPPPKDDPPSVDLPLIHQNRRWFFSKDLLMPEANSESRGGGAAIAACQENQRSRLGSVAKPGKRRRARSP